MIKELKISQRSWGQVNDQEVFLFKIESQTGSFVELTNYGASIVSIVVPDKYEKPGNVILGFSNFQGYLQDDCYIGTTIGRFANRIANAEFLLDGKRFHLEKNDNRHSNHGGMKGFNSRVFDFVIGEDGISFLLFSQDGEGGYPGNIQFKVEYTWNENNELSIRYLATTDQRTIFNVTNHSYFNLSADDKSVFDHELTIYSSEVLESDDEYIPTGVIIPAEDKTFFNNRVGSKVNGKEEDLQGLNHYYIFDKSDYSKKSVKCVLYDPESGRRMEVRSTYPGVQLYTGDFLSSGLPGHQKFNYKPFDGLCLECQLYPDSPNHPEFPSSELSPDKAYDEEITFSFSN